MRHCASSPAPDRIITDTIWDQLCSDCRQPALALLVQLAIKRIVQEVADDSEKERLCLVKNSRPKVKSPPNISNG